MLRVFLLAFVLVLAACSRPIAPGHIRLELTRGQCVSVGIFDARGQLAAQPVVAESLAAGTHDIDCRPAGLAPGKWSWRAVAFDPPKFDRLGTVGGGIANSSALDASGGGDVGPPCAVSADDSAVFLGWRSARAGREIVACEPGGRVLWGHHHGPAESGVRGLAADGGVVFVLADADGRKLYRVDAKTGEPQPWEGRSEPEIPIASLWGADAKSQPDRADYITAKNGRVYLTFAADQFVAVLDGSTGAYVTTLTGPQPGPMSFSITPMRDPQTGAQKVIDFGVAAIAGNGLAYFLMEHEPAWVMMSTTRWLQPDERIAALTLHGDTMKSDQVTIYTALAAPHHQVQLRPADAVEGFAVAVGAPGGRAGDGPWRPEALRDVHGVAVDATGQLWIVETSGSFGRFTVWRTDSKQGELVREIFGPLDPATLHVDESNPLSVTLGSLRWEISPETGSAQCVEQTAVAPAPTPASDECRHPSGLRLWSAPEAERGQWSFHMAKDGRVFAWRRRAGAELYQVGNLGETKMAGEGDVTFVSH